ncbi:MAG TPA: hypothetical protein VJ746_00530 [Nitrospira sp.]|nr:hypothetical protein [Nitrospira sp.]
MQVSLDAEQWTVHDDVSLLEILAQISNRARDKGRIVTALTIGGRKHTDRDLVPGLLARTGKETGPVEAISSNTTDILLNAKDAVSRFGELLKTEGESMARQMRSGTVDLSSLDGWLGQLAEYMEITERAHAQHVPGYPSESLVPWVEQFIEARAIPDFVRMADLLEYEVVPRFR